MPSLDNRGRNIPTTLHSVWCAAGVLAIRCMTCWHADLLGDDKLPIRRGNQTSIAGLKFKCSVCGERDFQMEVPVTHGAAAEFMARPVPAS